MLLNMGTNREKIIHSHKWYIHQHLKFIVTNSILKQNLNNTDKPRVRIITINTIKKHILFYQ